MCVCGGGGGEGAEPSSHVYFTNISIINTPKKFPYLLQQQGKTYPILETLMQALAFLVGSRVRFPTELILLVLKIHCLYNLTL